MEAQVDVSSAIPGVGPTFRSGVHMTFQRIGLGITGEDLACEELEKRGYAIIAKRYRGKTGEIDIIARDRETLVFVEVKARTTHEFGSAAEAVTPAKQHQLMRVAGEYLLHNRLRECPCRFDVVSIHLDSGAPEIEVFQNAFDA